MALVSSKFKLTKDELTPTKNRVYSRIYRQVMAAGGDRDRARSQARKASEGFA